MLLIRLFRHWAPAALCTLCFAACSPDSTQKNAPQAAASLHNPPCDSVTTVDSIPSILREASGVAESRTRPGTLWVNNDSENPLVIFALDTLAHIQAHVRITGIAGDADWEDIATARCGDHDCIYIADTGDNTAHRATVRLLRFPEPRSADSVVTPEVFPFRYPDGPHDAEALFILPGEKVFLVTKGRNAAVALFAYPGSLRSDTVTLRHIRDLTRGIEQFPTMVTGASASPDGRFVAIRTYSFLHFYKPTPGGDLLTVGTDSFPLTAAHEFQGEGVTLDDNGRVYLVGERGLVHEPAPLTRLVCTLK